MYSFSVGYATLWITKFSPLHEIFCNFPQIMYAALHMQLIKSLRKVKGIFHYAKTT